MIIKTWWKFIKFNDGCGSHVNKIFTFNDSFKEFSKHFSDLKISSTSALKRQESVIDTNIILSEDTNSFLNDNSHDNTIKDNRYENDSYIRRKIMNHTAPKVSNFCGVCWHSPSKKWRSSIQINNIVYHIGYYHSETKAGDSYLLVNSNREHLRKELFALGGYKNNKLKTIHHRQYFANYLRKLLDKKTLSKTSQYRGVHKSRKGAESKWMASIQINKVKYHIGTFDREIEASNIFEIIKSHHAPLRAVLDAEDNIVHKRIAFRQYTKKLRIE